MSKVIYVLSHDSWSSAGNCYNYDILPSTGHFAQFFESKSEAIGRLHVEADDVELIDTMCGDESIEIRRIINIDDRIVMLIHNKSIDEVIVEEWTIREKELV